MDATEIRAVHSMLHLVFHRNKNQHQRAKWWKWLSLLKHTTLDLAQSLDGARLSAAESHREHLAGHLIPRSYLYVDQARFRRGFKSMLTPLLVPSPLSWPIINSLRSVSCSWLP